MEVKDVRMPEFLAQRRNSLFALASNLKRHQHLRRPLEAEPLPSVDPGEGSDALAGCDLPTIEVHISNIYQREAIRRHSMTAEACLGVISGLGFDGYTAALRYLAKLD